MQAHQAKRMPRMKMTRAKKTKTATIPKTAILRLCTSTVPSSSLPPLQQHPSTIIITHTTLTSGYTHTPTIHTRPTRARTHTTTTPKPNREDMPCRP